MCMKIKKTNSKMASRNIKYKTFKLDNRQTDEELMEQNKKRIKPHILKHTTSRRLPKT